MGAASVARSVNDCAHGSSRIRRWRWSPGAHGSPPESSWTRSAVGGTTPVTLGASRGSEPRVADSRRRRVACGRGAVSVPICRQALEVLLDSDVQPVGPSVLAQEFTNALWRLERRGVITLAESQKALTDFEVLPLALVESGQWVRGAIDIARQHSQPRIFDALYLACAHDRGAELWTCDRRFVASFGPGRPPNLRLCPDDWTGAGV